MSCINVYNRSRLPGTNQQESLDDAKVSARQQCV